MAIKSGYVTGIVRKRGMPRRVRRCHPSDLTMEPMNMTEIPISVKLGPTQGT